MDENEKIYKILKTLNEENRLPTIDKIESYGGEYKSILGRMAEEGYITYFGYPRFNVNQSATIAILGISFIKIWEIINNIII